MRHSETSGSPFRDALRAWVRHKKKAFTFFCMTLAAVLLALVIWPKSYRSESKLFVRVGRETVTLDPTANMGQTVDVLTPREEEINSIAEILASRAMVEKVVDIIGEDKILESRSLPAGLSAISDAFHQLLSDETSDADRRDAAVRNLMKVVKIWATKRSTVISVRARAPTPELAQQIVATLVDVYKNEHLRLNRTQGSHEFFVEQADLLQKQLEATNKNLRDLKNDKQFGSIAGQLELLEDQKSDIERELLARQHQIAYSAAAKRSLAEMVEDQAELIVAKRLQGGFHNATDAMRQQLYDLEIKERELSKKYESDYPLLKALRKQLEDVRMIYGQENFRTASQEELNPNRMELQLELLEERAKEAGLIAASERLTGQHDELLAKLRDLNNYKVEVEQLQRKANLLEKSYQTYAENLEQARIDTAIEHERISNVNVVQAATLELKSVSPQKPLIAGLGLIVALAGSVAVALIADSNDDNRKTALDVELELDLPVWLENPCAEEQRVHV